MENFENKNEQLIETADEINAEAATAELSESEETQATEPVRKMRPATRVLLISLVILAFAAFFVLLSFSMANSGIDSYSELKNTLLG